MIICFSSAVASFRPLPPVAWARTLSRGYSRLPTHSAPIKEASDKVIHANDG